MDHKSLVLHARGLRVLAARLSRDDADADDVVQEAYLAALSKPPPHGVPLGNWLAGVVRNLARRRHRAEGRRARQELRAQGIDVAESTDEVVGRAEIHSALVEAVLALDEPYRSTILLRYFDDLSLRDIALRMRCPIGTVGRRIHEGLRLLRARLGGKHGRTWHLVITGIFTMKKTVVAAAVLAALLTGFLAWHRADRSEARTRNGEHDRSGTTALAADTAAPDTDHRTILEIDRDLDLHGEVIDEAGRPIANATLSVFLDPWDAFGFSGSHNLHFQDGPRTTSSANGTFSLRLRRGQQVNLRAEKTGFAAIQLWALQAGARVRVVMTSGVALTIVVLDPDGRPAAGTLLRLQQLPPEGHVRVTATGTTGADGRCTLRGLPPSSWFHIFGRHPQFGRVPWERRVDLPAQGTHVVTLRIREGRTLHGLVKDARTGEPVPGAELDSGWTFGFPVRAGQDGTFQMHGWGAGKEFELNARAPGYARSKTRVTSEQRIELALEPERPITGRIVDLRGRPVAGALIDANGRTADRRLSRGRTVSGDDGRFEINGLAAGVRHRIAVVSLGFGKTFAMQADDATDLGDIILKAARRIEGKVLWPDDAPSVGVKVTLESEASDDGVTVKETRWTDDLGRFRFSGIADGKHQIMAAPRGGKQVSQLLTVRGGDALNQELRLLAKHTLTARVMFGDGSPVGGAQVIFRTTDKWSFDRATDAEGRATVFSDTPFAHVERVYAFGRAEPFQFDGSVAVPEGATEVLVQVRRSGVARGTIVDPEGDPIAQANYEVFEDGRPLSQGGPFGGNHGWSDMQGRFELALPLNATVEIRLTGSVNRFSEGQKKLPPLGGRLAGVTAGRNDLVLRAEPLRFDRTLLARVLDPDGEPLAGAQVYAKYMGKLVQGANVLTGDDGRAELRGLPEAKCFVSARAVPAHPQSKNWVAAPMIVVPEGQEVTLRLGFALWLRGHVVDADAKPVAGADAYAYHAQSELGRTKTDAQGRFELKLRASQTMPIGLLVTAGDKQKRIDPFTPKAGEAVEIVIE